MTKFEKETRHRFLICMKKQNKSTVNSKKCETKASDLTRSVHLHRHDVLTVPLTVLLHYPIRRMMHTQIGLLMTDHIQEFCYSFGWGLKCQSSNCTVGIQSFQCARISYFSLDYHLRLKKHLCLSSPINAHDNHTRAFFSRWFILIRACTL